MLDFLKKIFKRKEQKAIDDQNEELKEKIENGEEKEEVTDSDGVAIHTMPERFRFEHVKVSKAKTVGLIIIICGAVFIIAGAVFLYFYLFKTPNLQTDKSVVEQIQPAEEEQKKEEAVAETQNQLLTVDKMKEEYFNMRIEFDNADSFSSLEEVFKKYGTQNRIDEFYKDKEQIDSLTGQPKYATVSMLKQDFPKKEEIQEISGSLDGNKATLYGVTYDGKKEGTIIMIFENSEWKLDSESWKGEEIAENNNIATTTESDLVGGVGNFENGIDSDGDGLYDKEEELVGSDPAMIDTDNDSYGDLTEVMNLYNPIAKDKLVDNQNIKTYENKTFVYSLLYPKSWLLSTIGGDDSVIFRSNDNHFFQVIVQPNVNKQMIEDWYKQQFSLADIDQANIISASTWRGIKNNDDLTVYLSDLGNKYIYTLSYNPGNSNILNYKNIFKALIKSFSLD